MALLGKFGHFLLQEGHASEETLAKAYALQNERPHMRLGEILVGIGVLSFEVLQEALDTYRSRSKVGELLLMNGRITRSQLDSALEQQPKSGLMLGKLLVEIGACHIQDVIDALGAQRRERIDPFGQAQGDALQAI